MTPGYRTTEFWVTLVQQIVPLLILLGLVKQDQAESIGDSVTQLITALFAVAASLGPVITYIRARTDLKKSGTLQ